MNSGLDAQTHREICSGLEALEDVRCVAFDAERSVFTIVHAPDGDADVLEEVVRDALASNDVDLDEMKLEFAVPASAAARERVRFISAERRPETAGRLRVRVTLEWNETAYTGEADGAVGGQAVELRTAAKATIETLEQLVDEPLNLRVIGVKRMRVFDEELVVVSLQQPEAPKRGLVGAVLVSIDPFQASVRAVLHAMNRTLATYLPGD